MRRRNGGGRRQHDSGLLWIPIVVFVLVITSLEIVTPGRSAVVQFFGSYIGHGPPPRLFGGCCRSRCAAGSAFRVRNFETNHLKVNDADGNPVEIAAIVVWQVADTAKSHYRRRQLRDLRLGSGRVGSAPCLDESPYDDTTDVGTSLRGSTDVRRR